MADYINRKALLKKLCDEDPSHMEDYYYNAIADFPAADVVSSETYEAVQKALQAMAETDVVQVVRCKKCIYGRVDEPDFPTQYYCDIHCTWEDEDHYCSDGLSEVEE